MNRKSLRLLLLLALVLTMVLALAQCGSNSSGDDSDDDNSTVDDDSDDDDADDDDVSDDDADDDSGDDDVAPTECTTICEQIVSCGLSGEDACMDQCAGLAQDALDCLVDAVDTSADCDQFEHFFGLCTHLDEIGTEIDDRMADFTLTNQDGEEVRLWDYVGYVIVINVGAGWCPPCQEEAPLLENNIYQVYKDQGLIVLSLMIENYGGGTPDVNFLKSWANTYGLTFPVLADPHANVSYQYLIKDGSSFSIPQNILVDRDMIIFEKMIGYWENLMKYRIESRL